MCIHIADSLCFAAETSAVFCKSVILQLKNKLNPFVLYLKPTRHCNCMSVKKYYRITSLTTFKCIIQWH